MNKIDLQAVGKMTWCQTPLCKRKALVYLRLFIGNERDHRELCLRHAEELIDERAIEL